MGFKVAYEIQVEKIWLEKKGNLRESFQIQGFFLPLPYSSLNLTYLKQPQPYTPLPHIGFLNPPNLFLFYPHLLILEHPQQCSSTRTRKQCSPIVFRLTILLISTHEFPHSYPLTRPPACDNKQVASPQLHTPSDICQTKHNDFPQSHPH